MRAWELAAKYQEQQTDPVQALEVAIELEKTAKAIFISKDYERAYREAEASKARWKAGQPLSILDGVPISWKDLFDVAGSVTTAGSYLYAQHQAAEKDAQVVAILTRMGLVNFGKTNMTEFAYSGLGLNPHFGTPPNIIDNERIPGGSSSGAALSVAMGITPISMGTDTAGSIRIPAAFNGIVGFRASQNRYPMSGVHPLATTVDTIGPLGSSVKDFYLLDQLIQGIPFPALPPDLNAATIRLVYDPEILEDPTLSPEVTTNFSEMIERLTHLGFVIERRSISTFKTVLQEVDEGRWIGAAEAYTLYQSLLESPDIASIDPLVSQRLLRSKEILASTQITLYQLAKRLRREVADELSGAYLLSPTVSITAPTFKQVEKSEHDYFDWNGKALRLTMPGSFLDMPGITLPMGVDQHNMPCGLLVSTYSGNDEALLQLGMLIQELI